MKKTIFTLLFAVAAMVSAYAQPKELVSGPAIKLDKDVHDYGEVPFGGNGECKFKVTNTGTEMLILTNCQGSCGCTVPKCDPNPILPGESSLIEVKYDTKRPGPIAKTVTINSNAVNEPVKVVSIKGNVGSDPSTSPSGAPTKAPSGAPAKQ
jgi:hypothetical protein